MLKILTFGCILVQEGGSYLDLKEKKETNILCVLIPASCKGGLNRSRLTARIVTWEVLWPQGFVGHHSPGEGLRRALRTAASTLWRARIRRQVVMAQVS